MALGPVNVAATTTAMRAKDFIGSLQQIVTALPGMNFRLTSTGYHQPHNGVGLIGDIQNLIK
ncbi:hypothetical protein ABVF61_00840 [Roseibium sp. HPY-6]|uniref:hypothetical protein n=1 Tax=Roseibium sp. HPY-6 TaxID=3229852 RepID=UPI00338F6D74